MLRVLLVGLVCVLASCCGPAQAQIRLQPEYASGQPVVVEVAFPDLPEGAEADVGWTIGGDAGYQVATATKIYVWPVYSTTDAYLPIRANGYLYTTNTAGEQVVVKGSRFEFTAQTKILGVGAGPVDPTPPVPPPTPDGTAPIKEPGFRVLVVYESKDLPAMPRDQQSILFDGSVRSYLNAKCVKGTDGKTAEWRMLDPNAVIAPDSAIWATAMARERKSLPWIVISDGKRGFEGPLPANVAETLALLKRYGGE